MSPSQYNNKKPNFDVIHYRTPILNELLSKLSSYSTHSINSKSHSNFLDNYLNDLNTKTVVIENNYIDHDFLEDYSGYYARCFKDYPRKCARLHFFTKEFTKRKFSNFLGGKSSSLSPEKLQSSYIGFIVVKPLPQTIIGRTCLKTYPEEGKRKFPTTRNYRVNLFGTKLTVESIAFQEQDKIAAACATSALWSAFQGTGKLFQHAIPSPVEITKLANTVPEETNTRSLPSSGLSAAQMAYAIRSLSLEPFLISVTNDEILKNTLYAYLNACIPLVMGINIYKNDGKLHGKHAVAITGYNLDDNAVGKKTSGCILRSSKIKKIYVHDD